jgi:succinate dehydrogenase / fumarate reductase cytochrome b subunit
MAQTTDDQQRTTQQSRPDADAASELTIKTGRPVPKGPPRWERWWAVRFYRSSIGKKWVMAVSGIILLGYVLLHMIGNLKVYLGRDEMNHYAEWLRTLLVPFTPRTVTLWILRTILIAAFFGHIVSAYQLTRMNQRARPVKYQSPRDYVAANFASRTMRWTGVIIGLFVIFHLLDLTWGTANSHFVRGDVYDNLRHSFQRPLVAAVYIVANLALAIHIYHGAWSLFQSLGWNNPRFNAWRRYFATGFAIVIGVGNISFPVMVLAGVIH